MAHEPASRRRVRSGRPARDEVDLEAFFGPLCEHPNAFVDRLDPLEGLVGVGPLHEREDLRFTEVEGLLEVEVLHGFDVDPASVGLVEEVDQRLDRPGQNVVDVDVGLHLDSGPAASAASGAFALSRDSTYSASGVESATIPPPTWRWTLAPS